MTTVPTFLVQNDRIVEVTYTEWTETATDHWEMTGGTPEMKFAGIIDRIIFETPVGCFQKTVDIDVQPGDTLTLEVGPQSGNTLSSCTQKAHHQNDNKQTKPPILAKQ